MQIAHNQGRDSIWKFILQNSYKPVFLMNRFDFVVGNAVARLYRTGSIRRF